MIYNEAVLRSYEIEELNLYWRRKTKKWRHQV